MGWTDGPMMDTQKDGCMEKIMWFLHTLIIRGSDVANLVEFHLVD